MSVVAAYCPDTGDIIYIDFDPQAGSEQSGRRPALVLSPKSYNSKTGLAVVCPITNQIKGFPFEVALPAGIKATGVVLSDHMKSMSWKARRASFLCDAQPDVVDEVKAKFAALIGLA